ncbi:hypothetical protein LV779_24095 [Streptomyces thinghirensis]|nr:hypothetical protein [Streptomyces thinghirensis]
MAFIEACGPSRSTTPVGGLQQLAPSAVGGPLLIGPLRGVHVLSHPVLVR